VLNKYYLVLKQAYLEGVNLIKWYYNWFKAYNKAISLNILKVKGALTIKKFFIVVKTKINLK
jgi:predicted GNAT superfamily acetyltransferase